MSELIYDALMLGRNRNVAREEYLTAMGEKSEAVFEAQEKNISLAGVVNDTECTIHLRMRQAGYAEIEVYSEDKMISFERKVISSEEFGVDGFEFKFTVLAGELHNRKNYARITFRNPICSASVTVTADNSTRVAYAHKNSRRKLAELESAYIDLRMGNLFQTEWQAKTLEILGEVDGGDVPDLFLMLYKANVFISLERMQEAYSLIEFVSSQIKKLKERQWDLICYFYYISSLYEMNDDVTNELKERVHTIFDMHPSWKILWILIYMDETLSNSPRDIIDLTEGEFLIRRCNSPVIYYEAMEAFRKDPGLIAEPSKFVISTLNFAAKKDFLSINVCIKFAEVIWKTDNRVLKYSNLDACIRILKDSYDRFQSNIILKSLCRVLICAQEKSEKFHCYYEKAIKEFIETKDLYNYFIYSAGEEKMIPLPEAVMEFFAGREYDLGPWRDYYFACLVRGKEQYRKYYNEALGNMIRSANEALDRGRVSTALAVVYRDLLDTGQLGSDRYARMLEMLSVREVVTTNSLITSALVFHREFNEYQESELKDGRGLVRIFTNDAVILFKDTAGNLYSNIDYVLRKFMPRSEYARLCIEHSPVTRYMLLGDNLKLLTEVREPSEILSYMYSNMGKGNLRGSYEQEILQNFIVDFSKDQRDKRVYDMLLKFLDFNLESSTRARLIEVMIDRMMFREAYAEIEKHGFAGISDSYVASLTHVLAEITDYQDDEVMKELACSAFLNSPHDPIIFKYMCRCYNDRLDVLILMYIAAKANGINDISITERVIRKMTEKKDFPTQAESIFADYFANGSDVQLKKDFMAAVSAEHLFKKNSSLEYIYKYTDSAFIAGEKLDDIAQVAYLMYLKDVPEPRAKSLKAANALLKDLVRRGICLEEFKEYGKYFDIPAALSNIYIAQQLTGREEEEEKESLTKKSMFASAPVIEFKLRKLHGSVSGSEAMKEVAPGIYTRHFTLFFGESVEYSINGGKKSIVSYNELNTVNDGSRYFELDAMIRKLHGSDKETLNSMAKDYMRKSLLIDKLF